MQLESILEEFPPCLCRLLARKGKSRRPYTNKELAELSGLSLDQVGSIAAKTDWDSVRVGDMMAFTKACGLDLSHMKRQRLYIKRQNWTHLRHPPSHNYFKSLMLNLYQSKLAHLHD